MASFLEELWNGVFTPGTSPTLLIATNVSFAALQLLLLALYLGTHSIHFLILSLLSGALWYSINWFVAEVQSFQATTQARGGEGAEIQKTARVPGAIDTESETETEGVTAADAKLPLPLSTTTGSSPSSSAPTGAMGPPPVPLRTSTATTTSSGSRPAAAAKSGAEAARQRNNNPADSSGYVSTDSEWEKVEEER